MPKITLTPGVSYRYTGTEGVYSVILGELVAGADVPVEGGGGGDPFAGYYVYEPTGSLDNAKVLTFSEPLLTTDSGTTLQVSVPGVITSSVPIFDNQAFFKNNVQMYQTLNVTGSLNLASTGAFLITHTGSSGQNLTIASTTGNVLVEGTTFTGNNISVPGTSTLAGNVSLTGNSQTVTHSGTGNLTISSTSGNVLVESTTFAGNDVTIPGDLTVQGGDITISDTAAIRDSGTHSRIQFTNAGDTLFGNASGTTSLVITGSAGGGVSVVGPLSIGGNQIRASGSVAAVLSITGSDVDVAGNLMVRRDQLTIFSSDRTPTIYASTANSTGSIFDINVTKLTIGSAASEIFLGISGGTTTVKGTLVGTQTTQNLFNTAATTLNIGGEADVNIGKSTGTTTIKNTNFDLTNATTVALKTTSAANITHTGGGSAHLTISSTNGAVFVENTSFNGQNTTIGSTGAALNVGSSGTSNSLRVYGTMQVDSIASIDSTLTVGGDLNVNGASSADIATTTATATVFNTNANRVDIAGGASVVEIGSSSGTTSVNNNLFVDGKFGVTGSFNYLPESVTTTDVSLGDSDSLVIFNLSSASRTLTLPNPNLYPGRQVLVKRIDTNGAYTLTLTCSAGAANSTVEGLKSYGLGPRSGVVLVAAPSGLTGAPWSGNGSDWMIL
jgi:hypothetical protein